nr:helicase-related protein [Marinitoga lauensis]
MDIVVGTPGRVLDHIKRRTLDLSHVRYFILDEADEMLDMGFIDDVEDILSNAPENRQILLFSATMPSKIISLAKKHMKNYKIISVKPEQLTTELTEQIYFEVSEQDKFEALCRIIDIEPEFYGLVFCRTKVDVDTVSNRLIDRGYNAEALHGDLSQYQRERILRKFKSKRANILVATDVAARGIDINDLTHVINYSLPQNPESYVHRIGRTGRAGKEGTAITFVTPEEYRKLLFIKRISKSNIKKMPIPKVKDVIETKKLRIKSEINSILEHGTYENYMSLAKEMLEDHDPQEVMAAVLKYAFQDELDERNYREIKEVSSVDKKGKTRLFVALGRDDDLTIEKLKNMIKEYTNIQNIYLKDVRILDKFSFMTVPFEEAEIILQAFKKKKRGRKPIISKAKEKRERRTNMKVQKGSVVKLHYKGTLNDGSVFDTSEGREPLEFTAGAGQVIPGFDKAVMDMEIGEKKTFTIPAEEAYGEYSEEKVFELPRQSFPPNIDEALGQTVQLGDQSGNVFLAKILEVTDETVKMDTNHPLAGKDLTFEIEIVEIN